MTPVRPGRTAVLGAVVAATVCIVSACGAPGSTRTSEIDPTEVPYRLLEQPEEPLAAASRSDVPTDAASTPVYLLARDGLLQAAPAQVAPGPPEELAKQVLARLQDGPTAVERDEGLTSVLGSATVSLSLVGVRGGTARVEVEVTAGELAADQLPLALGQVVLTLTAVEGIDRVQLVSGGEPVEMALPGGALTTAPVSAADYVSLVVPPG